MNESRRARRDEIATRVVGYALLAGCIPMAWWDNHWPGWLVGILNPVLVTAVAWLLARWKRSRLAWGMFWLLAGISAVSLTWLIATGFRVSNTVGPATLGGLALIAIIVCLVKIPRLHPDRPPEVSHVIHHHVLHQPGAELPALDGLDEPRQLPAVVRRAIEAPKAMPEHIAEAVRQAVRRGGR